ncbi:MAG: Asp-tRNA(Asn)/Glu-tRNA(Gln) amidotransferase subunit GatC [Thiohalobacteraceae bacterium]|nr:Asp-tRNA(Asn)/Glu-tRNA(Gln) amidotransferase subunit GatC [Gammaproteobacteria bacterium]
MALDSSAVNRIAQLAQMGIAAQDAPEYARNLSAILAFVAQLDAVDCSGVPPMAHPLDTPQRLREDAVTESDQRDKFQAQAPKVEAGLYLVPKVIE